MLEVTLLVVVSVGFLIYSAVQAQSKVDSKMIFERSRNTFASLALILCMLAASGMTISLIIFYGGQANSSWKAAKEAMLSYENCE